jgi:hypothetical protein
VRINYLIRGHGFGHAARDLRVINAIRALRPDAQLDIASSGTGFQYLSARSVDCADLGIADEADLRSSANWKTWRYLHVSPHPDLVVTDEVISALPFCHHVMDVPCVVLTDWFFADFGQPELDRMFNFAAEIMVLDFVDAHPRRIQTRAPITPLGPVVDELSITQTAARQHLGTGDGSSLTAVVSLGGMTERPEVRQMLQRTLAAWHGNARRDDRLLILADDPRPAPEREDQRGVTWVGITDHPEVYYAAADVVITDALGFTNCELAFNQIPAVAFRVKEVVDKYAESFSRRIELLEASGAMAIVDDSAGPDLIWQAIGGARPAPGAVHQLSWARPRDVAERILRHLPDQ